MKLATDGLRNNKIITRWIERGPKCNNCSSRPDLFSKVISKYLLDFYARSYITPLRVRFNNIFGLEMFPKKNMNF